jgi:glutamine synthetase adenylyltransferase
MAVTVRPFVYRRYIDFTAIEALQDMHAAVSEDARRRDRMDDIKRGPGGIREIEFLAQCFQLLRGGRDTALQTPSLHRALAAIQELGLLNAATVADIRADYIFLRRMENRLQAMRDRQTHSITAGGPATVGAPCVTPWTFRRNCGPRTRVTQRFQSISLLCRRPVPTALG